MYKKTYISMFWLMLHNIIFVICSLVDIACANSISEDAVIAITVAFLIYTLMINVHDVFAKALRIMASRYFGAEGTEQEQSLLTSTITLTESIALGTSAMIYIFGQNILGLFALTDIQKNLAYTYLQYRMIGYCIYAFTNPIIKYVESHDKCGKVVRVRLINLINIPLSIILAKTAGIGGMGLGTSITELSELILVMIVFKPRFGKFRLQELSKTIKLGLSYIPECLCSPLINNLSTNMCLMYLNTNSMVISQLVNTLYDNIVNIVYKTTQQAEISIGKEYGAENQAGIIEEFKKFKHCYIRILLLHFPITIAIGWLYLGLISPVSNLSFALLLLIVRILSAVAYYVGISTMRILYIFGIIKPVIITRMFGLCVMQLLTQWIALECGAGVFCIPVSYFCSDILWAITNTWILHKKRLIC